jgi:hypothetical protein
MAENRGRFKAGNKAAVKDNKHTSKYFVANNAAKDKLPIEKKPTETNSKDYQPFGEKNDFPNRCVELNRKSGVSRAITTSKNTYIVGQGFESDNAKFQTFKPNVNENLWDVTWKLERDRILTGNYYMELIRDRRTKQIFMYHVDSTLVRIHKDGEHAIIHPDWRRYDSYKSMAKVVPLYPNFEVIDGKERSIYHVKDYENEFKYYGIPSNLGALDSVNINYKTNKWNLSRLENAFNSSGILVLQADFSDDDAKAFNDDFNNKFIGEGQTGKLLKVVNQIGGEPNNSKFIPITTNEDGHWTQLHEQAINEIIISNQWFASLAGLNIANGFDTNRIRNDYQIAMATVIPYEQKVICDNFMRILNEQMAFNIDDLRIINKSPIPMNELDSLYKAIIEINKEVKAGNMSEEMAIKCISISYQLPIDKVEEIWA